MTPNSAVKSRRQTRRIFSFITNSLLTTRSVIYVCWREGNHLIKKYGKKGCNTTLVFWTCCRVGYCITWPLWTCCKGGYCTTWLLCTCCREGYCTTWTPWSSPTLETWALPQTQQTLMETGAQDGVNAMLRVQCVQLWFGDVKKW